MEFRISDTFTSSLGKLTNDEQKAVKTTSFDLQVNPANPGLQFHRIEKSKDDNFWSIRVSRDIRVIVHKTNSSLMLCYVDHHDKAYEWASRRKIDKHPVTGAAQLVEVRESIKEIVIPRYIEKETNVTKPPLFESYDDSYLLGFGIPSDWLEDVKLAHEDNLFSILEHLPAEASEALLEIATGGTPQSQVPVAVEDPFEHPDAQRRFKTVETSEELQRALDYPWEKWTIFLHPSQSDLVEKTYNGPARISGSAGTGKTIVALHRAVFLVKSNDECRVLLTTFSETLANALRVRLKRLIGNEPKLGDRIEVHSMRDIGERLFKRVNSDKRVLSQLEEKELVFSISNKIDHPFSNGFIYSEWSNIVDSWRVKDWDDYKNVKRLGRKKRLAETQRKIVWGVCFVIIKALEDLNAITLSEMYSLVSDTVEGFKNKPFEYIVVDECQDLSVAQLRFLASLGRNETDSLFLAGDLGQRIFQQPFSWKSLGIDIRGRSQTLRVNYRTSQEIRSRADHLLPDEITDVDGNSESRLNTVSMFKGEPPLLKIFNDEKSESSFVSEQINELVAKGYKPHEIGIFVRTVSQSIRAIESVNKSNLNFSILDESLDIKPNHLSIGTMHLAKGLEFRAVFVMCCDDEVIPLQSRIESVSDESDLEEVYNTERHLLYVACTRARDYLAITATDPESEFLDDFNMK
ncbi:MAG: DNA helicase [Halobacteriovorax sp.]|nr:DNA helicase [Halobacteriovorax sp.]